MLRVALFLIISFVVLRSEAQYPSAKRNSDLNEEVASDRNRIAPRTERFAFAADGDVYFRNIGPDEFYHGIGYFLQFRTEVRPQPGFRLNLRSVLYAGSCSGGYVEPSGSYHLVSLTIVPGSPILGGQMFVRGADVGRQTIGQGLFIQDKEFNGALAEWHRDSHKVVFRADGTGLLRLNDDTYNWELSINDGVFGGGVVFWPQGEEQDQLSKDRDPLYYAFSTQTFDWFTYAGEFGSRGGINGGLVSLAAKASRGDFAAELKIEGRRYNSRFAADFAGKIEQQFISYEQYDKAFTNAANLFVVDDGAYVGAAHLSLWLKLNAQWRLHSLNETGRFDYESRNDQAYYFFRQGAEYCLSAERDDCLNFFVSNKVLMNSYARPPRDISRSNEAMFKSVPFAGIEARFRF